VVAKTKTVVGGNKTFHYRLHALDITTGDDRVAPADINGTVPGISPPSDGHGHVVFDPQFHMNRPGLLLLNGVVYVAFASHCDVHIGSYHGWVFGFNAATLARTGVYCTTPSTPAGAAVSAGGIWQGGMGVAADPSNFLFFSTGNGNFGGNDFGDSVVKLSSGLAFTDFFTPSDEANLLANDTDLGSGGVLILPDPPPIGLPRVLVMAGKDGRLLLINRDNMGHFTPGGPDKLVQVPPINIGGGLWGGPAYYRSSQNQQFVYFGGDGGHLGAFLFSGTALTLAKVGGNPNQSPQTFGDGGTTPNVSSNQQNPGTAVIWAIARGNPVHLQAFDATNLTHKLFDSGAGPWTSGNAMIEPTTIQGKVYVAASGQLTVFGL
jgi:hypothetical protein